MTYSIKQTMFDSLPYYYENSKVAFELIDKEADELYNISQSIQDILLQLFVNTATWGLDFWEKEVGIVTDPSISYDERRSRIKARIRGNGTVTKELLKNISESYAYGTVEVTEIPSNFEVHIKFIDDRGVPTNFELLKKSISENVPAHLQVTYEFTYMAWKELDLHSWDETETENGTGLTFDELEVWI